MTTKWIAVCALALSMSLGCGESKKKPEESPKPVPTEPAEPAAPELTDEQVPVAADFEEEADKEITAENYKAELDKLAAEAEPE
jgi:hypothetical protein